MRPWRLLLTTPFANANNKALPNAMIARMCVCVCARGGITLASRCLCRSRESAAKSRFCFSAILTRTKHAHTLCMTPHMRMRPEHMRQPTREPGPKDVALYASAHIAALGARRHTHTMLHVISRSTSSHISVCYAPGCSATVAASRLHTNTQRIL